MHALHKMHNGDGDEIAASVDADAGCAESIQTAEFCEALCIADGNQAPELHSLVRLAPGTLGCLLPK
jgi:hypothetical protein